MNLRLNSIDGTYKGLLVEPAVTNLCKQSEDITTTWSPIQATLTANDTTAPDGATTADKLNDDSGGGTGSVYVQQVITVSAATKYTASVFLKADQLAFAALQALNYDGGISGQQYFGLSGAGSLGTASNLDDSSITAYPNGWYRCSITWTQGASDTSFYFRIYLASSISSLTVQLDGTSSIFVWGAQVETGPIATSYIPTTTAQVQRVKDDITLGSASSLIGQTEGTLYLEVDWRDASGLRYLLTASDNSVSDFVNILTGNTNQVRAIARVNNSELCSIEETGATNTGVTKIAFAYKTNDFELYKNGSSLGSVTTGSVVFSSVVDKINLGAYYNDQFQANMWIPAAALYPTRLSDAEAQALTTL